MYINLFYLHLIANICTPLLFLVANKRLYIRVCPSVSPLVGLSVGPSVGPLVGYPFTFSGGVLNVVVWDVFLAVRRSPIVTDV